MVRHGEFCQYFGMMDACRRPILIAALASALLCACAPAEEETEGVQEQAAEKKVPEPREHIALEQSQIEGKAFALAGVENQADRVVFEDARRYRDFLRRAEKRTGDYHLTPDGRLCFVIDDNAGANCWRQAKPPSADGTLSLEYNPGGTVISLSPEGSAQ